MKNNIIRLNLLLLTSLFLSFCSEDTIGQDSVEGKWNLISYECCNLPLEKFSTNEIQWTFQDGKLRIDNNVDFDESTQYSFQQEGKYDYEVLDSTISISYNNRSRAYELTFENGYLILSRNPASDGSVLKFKR